MKKYIDDDGVMITDNSVEKITHYFTLPAVEIFKNMSNVAHNSSHEWTRK